MKISETIGNIRAIIKEHRLSQKTIGFVPTMGALHEGHISLIHQAKRHSNVVVASIFVNPTQFNNEEDLRLYPRNLEKDIEMLNAAGCDILFVPSVSEIYSNHSSITTFSFGDIERVMEGKFRPGHFAGVTLVVSKLFNIVLPDIAFFGEKDLQQLAIVKTMVKDLNFPIEICGVQTMRESNGLAMSSRNMRLSSVQQEKASLLYKGLCDLKIFIENKKSIVQAKIEIEKYFSELEGFKLEYLAVVDSLSLDIVNSMDDCETISACAAAYIGGVRIIDNIYLKKV